MSSTTAYMAGMGSVLRAVLRSEAGIARAYRDAFLPPRAAGARGLVVPYAGRFGLVIGTMCVLGALETAVVHVLVPWPAGRWALFAASVYALVWCVGFGLSLRQHPHLLRDDELVLRFGHFRSVVVPLAGLAAVRRSVESGHRRTVLSEGDRLAVSVMGDTNVELTFDPPVRVPGQPRPVARVAFFADEPRAAVRELRGRVGAAG